MQSATSSEHCSSVTRSRSSCTRHVTSSPVSAPSSKPDCNPSATPAWRSNTATAFSTWPNCSGSGRARLPPHPQPQQRPGPHADVRACRPLIEDRRFAPWRHDASRRRAARGSGAETGPEQDRPARPRCCRLIRRRYGASERQVNRRTPWAMSSVPVNPNTEWFRPCGSGRCTAPPSSGTTPSGSTTNPRASTSQCDECGHDGGTQELLHVGGHRILRSCAVPADPWGAGTRGRGNVEPASWSCHRRGVSRRRDRQRPRGIGRDQGRWR